MYGAILGDIIGSPYEFDAGEKTKEFPLFSENSVWTDDTVMTIAVADAFLTAGLDASEEALQQQLVKSMRYYGKRFPRAGYGLRFWKWLHSWRPKPYNSFGNGSAMRVSSVAWLYNDLESVRKAARISAEVTHNHPEGIKGAEATATAIFLARTGRSKEEIKTYIVEEFGYDLSRTCDEIRPGYFHVQTCQETVPEAITAFLEGESFEDVIRTAVSLGGDCDTVAAIAGSIAEGFYDVPEEFKTISQNRLPAELQHVLDVFTTQITIMGAAVYNC
jgi:ADP-ribosylglycohydrolase